VSLRLGVFYYVGLALAVGFMMHQYQLIRERSPQKCFAAFLNNNWVGAAIFAGIALDVYYRIRLF
jgi:4-hydroxybenzoate polyprenyltransferase